MGFRIGTCVETTLGTGVLVEIRPEDAIHVVRLWRSRGPGSARAYLNPASILRTLPAAVGVRAKTPEGDGLVVRFMSGRSGVGGGSGSTGGGGGVGGGSGSTGGGGGVSKADVFLVQVGCAADEEMVLVDMDNISCPVAEVMPLVERVMDRSNALVTAETKSAIGNGARDLLSKIEGSVRGIDAEAVLGAAADTLDGREKGKISTPMAQYPGEGEGADLGDEAAGVSEERGTEGEQARAQRESQRAAEARLAELTRIETARMESLLESGRQRLEGLIDAALSGGSGNSKSGHPGGPGAEDGVEKAGAELMRLWEEGKEQLAELAGKGEETLELDKHFATLKTLSKESPELAKIVADLENGLAAGAAKARELQSQVEATKTVGVLMDGKARLEAGLGDVIDTYRGDESVAMAMQRGGRLLKAMTEKESPVVTKGMKLLKGAQERVIAQGQGDGWNNMLASLQSSSVVSEGQGRLAEMFREAAEAGGVGGTIQDVMRLLQGDPTSRATDASIRFLENSILAYMEAVPPPRRRTTVSGSTVVSAIVGADGGDDVSSAWKEASPSLGADGSSSSPSVKKGENQSPEGGAQGGVVVEGEGGGWCAQDLVDLFERGELAEELMRGLAKQASSQALSIMERLSEAHLAEGSRGMESLRLLQGYQRGDTGLDEAVTCALDFLNSEEGQSLAGGLVSHAERGLESLKTMSMDGAVGKVLGQLADPGLERRILQGIEGLDTDELLETADKAFSDVDARTRLLDGIKDSTVDFLLEYLPHIEVPPISGTSSRVRYAITNLDLSGFRLRKEDVDVRVVDLSGGLEVAVKEGGSSNNTGPNGSIGGTVVDGVVADSGIEDDKEMAAIPWGGALEGASGPPGGGPSLSPAEQSWQAAYVAVFGGAGTSRLPEELQVSGIHLSEGDNLDSGAALLADDGEGRRLASPPAPPSREEMAPAEVLRVVTRGVSAEFKTLQWACRQETFPYTHGNGTADATVVDGYVSLGFSIKRGIVDREKGVEGPLLVLSTRTVTLDRLELTVANCRMAWLINLLTRLFSSTISTYVCRSLQEQVDGHASDLLGTVNAYAKDSWPFLLSLTNLKLEDFPLASDKELAMARGEGRPQGAPGGIMASIAGLGGAGAAAAAAAVKHRALEEAFEVHGEGRRKLTLKGFVQEEFGVVFDEDGPLGMQVDIEKGVGGARVVVSGLHPGGQAERLLGGVDDGGGAPSFSLVGSELLTVGGTSVQGLEGTKVLGLLRSSPRPVQMIFRCYVPDVAEAVAAAALGGDAELPPPPEGLVTATFKQKSLGVKFRASPTLGTRVTTVAGFSRDVEGRMREAEASGLLSPGQLLYSVNGKQVMGLEFTDVVRGLQKVARPVTFGLVPHVDVHVTVDTPPLELELRRVSGRVTVTGFCEVPTALEASGAIQLGDSILSVNGIPLPGAGCYRKDVALLEAPGMFPIRLRISRGSTGSGVDASDDDYMDGFRNGAGGGLEGSLSKLKQYQSAVSSSPSEVVAATPEELSLKVEEGKDGRPVVRSMPYVRGKLEKGGVIQPGMVLVGIDGAPVAGGHFASVSDCRRCLDAVTYPCTLTFRDMPKYIWLARLLAMRNPA